MCCRHVVFCKWSLLGKRQKNNAFVCAATDLLKHELKSIFGDVLNLTWHKAIKEIKKGTAYSEYTLKQESVALLKDIHRYYGAFELTFFEESKKTLIYQSKELNIKDIDMNYPIKMNSAIRIV